MILYSSHIKKSADYSIDFLPGFHGPLALVIADRKRVDNNRCYHHQRAINRAIHPWLDSYQI